MKIPNEVIFTVLRVLKKVNPGDLYYDNYLFHYKKWKEDFYDIYHFSWEWVLEHHPKRILEIGTRTGISLAQLLCAYMDPTIIERIISCDLFNDGFISPALVRHNLKALLIPDSVVERIDFRIQNSRETLLKLKDEGLTEYFDYILVDGSHAVDDAKHDLEKVKPLIAKGGVIVFDDIAPDGMSLDPVWQEFKKEYLDEFEWHENYNGKGLGWAIKK